MSIQKVLLCPSAFYPSLGGVEEIARNLALEYQKRGIEVLIATNRHPESLPQADTFTSIEVRRFFFSYPSRSFAALVALPKMLSEIGRFMQLLFVFKPQLLHVICPSSNSLSAFLAAQFLGTKVLVTLQGELFMDSNGLYDKSAFARACLSRLLGKATELTSCSRFVLTDAQKRFPREMAQKSVRIVFNGVNLDEWKTKGDHAVDYAKSPFILAAGRLVKNKNFDLLLKAFALSLEDQNDHLLCIAGDGDEMKSLQDLSQKLGIAERVQFLGARNREQIRDLFSQASFFVIPSAFEPFGIVCLEAMAAGKAFIAVAAGGIPEFVQNGQEALLIDRPEPSLLAQAILELVRDPALSQRLGENGAQRVKDFAWPSIADQYLKLYEEIAGGKS